jgi:hypothetical protein
VIEQLQQYELIVDSEEQCRERPSDYKTQKKYKIISSQRIFVEHLIRVVKIFKAGQERFRLRKDRYASVLLTICGLVRLRKGSLILEIVKDSNFEKTIEVIKHHSFGMDLSLVTSKT